MNKKIFFNYFISILLILNLINSFNCQKVVPPRFKTSETCVTEDKSVGVIDQYLNKPFVGKFVFHPFAKDATDHGGPCGTGTIYPYHTCVPAQYFVPDPNHKTWKASCLPGKRFMRFDKVCINKCVLIEANGKTLQMPIMDVNSDLKMHELDVTEAAYTYFQPNKNHGWVNATITFVKCFK
ncbi:putative pathogenicity factor [Meloidogyne graminicola]|uniref:Putative pathogenicity factor n=1 Tax=Meloidogyne graminicola TaxID=189291 RepID=A0A8S9ZJJ0_9BILA|nr:putative pathogenicity factor [Meloidogyne graminicola]